MAGGWLACYLSVLLAGLIVGFGPEIVFTTLTTGAIPILPHLFACSRVMRQTKKQHPEKWKEVGRTTQVRSYLFDNRDFGDPVIAQAKADLKWWRWPIMAGILLYMPTLLLVWHFGTKRVVSEVAVPHRGESSVERR